MPLNLLNLRRHTRFKPHNDMWLRLGALQLNIYQIQDSS